MSRARSSGVSPSRSAVSAGSGIRQRASNKTPRLINSDLVLHIIRERQPISRVDLARASGLQPSTVSLIVEGLLAEGWLSESEPTPGAMGRRPRPLTLSRERCVLGIDLHPRRAALAVVDVSGAIEEQREIDLPADPAKAMQQLLRAVQSLLATLGTRNVGGIGMCLPGRTGPDADDLVFAPNLRWPMMKLRTRMERATGLPVRMDNVANACTLLEVWESSEQRQRDFVVVEVSEGIGAGIFLNGDIARGKDGMAGEFGHIPMEPDGLLCTCGNRGCWETLASHRAAVRYYMELASPPRKPRFERILELARQGDPHALAALDRMALYLGRGLQWIAATLAPEEIILVGDITGIWDKVGPRMEAELRRHSLARKVRLRPSSAQQAARLRSAVPLVHMAAETPA